MVEFRFSVCVNNLITLFSLSSFLLRLANIVYTSALCSTYYSFHLALNYQLCNNPPIITLYNLLLVLWSYSTTCVYSAVSISVLVLLSPGLASGFTLTIFLSRLFLNSTPCSIWRSINIHVYKRVDISILVMGNDSGINEYDRRNPELSDATLRITTTRHHQYRVIIPLQDTTSIE